MLGEDLFLYTCECLLCGCYCQLRSLFVLSFALHGTAGLQSFLFFESACKSRKNESLRIQHLRLNCECFATRDIGPTHLPDVHRRYGLRRLYTSSNKGGYRGRWVRDWGLLRRCSIDLEGRIFNRGSCQQREYSREGRKAHGMIHCLCLRVCPDDWK